LTTRIKRSYAWVSRPCWSHSSKERIH
jgi:hypothetical protein